MPIKTLYEGGNVPAGGDDLLITSKKILGQLWNLSSGGVGTVTSVDVSVPSYMSSSGGPITTSGTIALGFSAQSGNKFLGSPSDGSSGALTVRALVAADIPNLDAGKITSGTIALARLSGITTSQLSASAGILETQLADQFVTPGTYGSATQVGRFTVTTHGIVTAASSVSIAIPASQITSGQLALARGGTNADLSATGGASQVLKQTSVGGAITVAQLSYSDISGTVPVGSLPVQATYVDNTNGSNGTGVAGRFDKPFKTIQAAITATTAPLPVFVRADTTSYDEQITLKNNVPVIFEKGAILDNTASTGNTVTYPGTANENYIILGHGQILCRTATGGYSAVSGGVTGSGYLYLQADVIAGRGTNGNKAINFATSTSVLIDPNTASAPTSRIDVQYIEFNHKVAAAFGVDINYGGGPADIHVGNITNLSATAGVLSLRIQTQTGLQTQNLGVLIDNLNDTSATGSLGQPAISLLNSAGGSTVISFNCDSVIVGNKTAFSLGSNIFVEARVIQNNSSSVDTISGGSTSSGNSKIRGALIQNVSTSSTSTPIINGHNYDGSLLFEECRFENPSAGATLANSPIILVRDANSFHIFDDCVFYLCSSAATGLIDLVDSTAAAFKGTNIVIQRAGTSANSIGTSATPTLRSMGQIWANLPSDTGITVLGDFIYDSTMTLANAINKYYA